MKILRTILWEDSCAGLTTTIELRVVRCVRNNVEIQVRQHCRDKINHYIQEEIDELS